MSKNTGQYTIVTINEEIMKIAISLPLIQMKDMGLYFSIRFKYGLH